MQVYAVRPGACCLPDGTCMEGSEEDCLSIQGGEYQGDGTDCGQVSCPQPGDLDGDGDVDWDDYDLLPTASPARTRPRRAPVRPRTWTGTATWIWKTLPCSSGSSRDSGAFRSPDVAFRPGGPRRLPSGAGSRLRRRERFSGPCRPFADCCRKKF